MILKIYGVHDNVEGDHVFFFQSLNEGTMKRVVKSSMLSKEPNVMTTNLKDKAIYELGEVETKTGVITPCTPVYIVSLAEVRLDLIKEVKIAKQEAGVENPDASEVVSDE